MSDDSFQRDVLNELGDDGLRQVAGLLGTDATGARDVVGTTTSALTGGLDPETTADVRQAMTEAAPEAPATGAPLQGVATLGGGLGASLAGGLLAKVTRPVANAVAKKTGLPPATVARALEVLLPVVITVMTKRAAARKAPGTPGSASDGDRK